MPDYVFPPSPTRVIPATMGADCQFVLRRRTPPANADDPPGAPVDWPDDMSVSVRIGTRPEPAVVNAVIVGADATVRIPSAVMDQVRDSTTWQVIASLSDAPLGDDPTLDKPMMVGHFERNDGTKS